MKTAILIYVVILLNLVVWYYSWTSERLEVIDYKIDNIASQAYDIHFNNDTIKLKLKNKE